MRPKFGRRGLAVAAGGVLVATTALVVWVSPGKPSTVDPVPTPSPTLLTQVPVLMLNQNVDQDTVRTSICVSGWTATVRPPASYTTNLKRTQLATAGVTDQNLADYEEDHWIPLELGGNPRNPENLWPELWPDAHRKDQRENALHKAVCAGTMTLYAAQLDMYLNWGPQPPFPNARTR